MEAGGVAGVQVRVRAHWRDCPTSGSLVPVELDPAPSAPGSTPAQPEGSPPPAERRRRLGLAVAVIVLGVVLAAALAGYNAYRNAPLRETVTDRTGPALLLELRDLSEFHAATGEYQVIVDQEVGRNNVPSQLSGQRTLFVAYGTVDAVVDFGLLGQGGVQLLGDDRVTVTLRHARLGEPSVDVDKSYVYSRERGVLDRLGGLFTDSPTDDGELYQLAQGQLEDAAETGELLDRAEQNTTAMLEGLLGSLGFDDVTVRYR